MIVKLEMCDIMHEICGSLPSAYEWEKSLCLPSNCSTTLVHHLSICINVGGHTEIKRDSVQSVFRHGSRVQ